MREWKICGALAITLLVLAAPLDSAGQGRPRPEPWVQPDGLLIGFNGAPVDGTTAETFVNGELNEAFLDIFETDLDWIVQDQPIHELLVWNWWEHINSAFVRLEPEMRRFKLVPPEAAERRLGKLKAALENLPYVKAVHLNGIFCRPDL